MRFGRQCAVWKVLLPGWLLVCLSIFCRAGRADEPVISEYQVKAAFLLNFTRFVQWPPAAFAGDKSPFTICVLGEDPFGQALDQTVKGETLNGRPLTVERIRRAPEPKACQVLFVSTSGKETSKTLAASGPGILTVGEGTSFLRDGGIIAFVMDNRHVRFDINQRAAANASLAISSKLLSVARSVER